MTEDEAADWMLRRYQEFGFIYQEEAASYLVQFGDESLAYFDRNSNLCVGKKVLSAFERLTPDAVYERRDKFWRRRLVTDQRARLQ